MTEMVKVCDQRESEKQTERAASVLQMREYREEKQKDTEESRRLKMSLCS